MQKINIWNNELDKLFEKDFLDRNEKKCRLWKIYNSDKKIIYVKWLDCNLKEEKQLENRELNDNQKYKFFNWYINQKQVKVCSYCWKNYITYFCNDFYKKKYKSYKIWDCKPSAIVSWFDIEHFFPKNFKNEFWKKPYVQLAKNLYNWHLSCTICNQRLKWSDDPLKNATQNDPIFNPYFGWIYKEWDEIKVDNSEFDDKVTFVWNPNSKIDWRKQVYKTHHWDFFRLWEIYLSDQETYNIFNFIYDKYTKIKDEYQRFKKTSKSIEEFVDYFFKNYYPEKEQDILKYSNWKLKKDLIQYLDKILNKKT